MATSNKEDLLSLSFSRYRMITVETIGCDLQNQDETCDTDTMRIEKIYKLRRTVVTCQLKDVIF